MASVWGELKRCDVVKVPVAYVIVGWLLVEIASTVMPTFEAPQWLLQTITSVVILGFPLALLSWAFDLTPDGVERTKSVPRSDSITKVTSRKLDFVIIGVLAIVVAFFAVERLVLVEEAPSSPANTVDRRSIAVLPYSNDKAAEEISDWGSFVGNYHFSLSAELDLLRDTIDAVTGV